MDTRKIMALGKSSLVISLPKDWLRLNNLYRGDRVSLEVLKDLSLVVHPNMKPVASERRRVVVIEADEEEDSIIRIIISCYLNGYNTIQLTSKKIFTESQQKAIRSVVKSLYMRIIEANASEVVFQTLMDESMASVESGIERMHIITNSMFSDVVVAMKTWDRDLASSSFSLEDDVDQFMYFLHRVIRSAVTNPSLATKLGLDMLDCLDYQKLVDHIERVADQIDGIAHSIVFLHDRQDIVHELEWGILVEAADIAQKAYEQAVEFSLTKTIDKSNMIIDQQGRVRELLMKITPLPELVEYNRDSLGQLIVIRNNIQRISEYAADIAEITIDRAYKPLG